MKLFKKMSKKKVIVTIIIVLVVGFIGYKIFGGNGGPEYILEKVTYGTVIKEVSETGMVKVSEQADLGFKNSGRISEIYVSVGDEVIAGQKLAKLNTTQLYIELSEAQAALDVANADYNNLLAGSSAEEIKIAETDLINAQATLDNNEQTLEDVRIDAEEDLNQAYEDSISTLDEAYLDMYNALNAVQDLKRSYFGSSDQEGIRVSSAQNKIEEALNDVKSYIDNIGSASEIVKIDLALSKMKDSLADTKDALEQVREATESGTYSESISSSEKTIIDNHKSYINTAHTDIVNAQQTISTTKITNDTNINSAEANVSSAEIALQRKEDELALKKADPIQEAINLYLAKIKQAQARVSLLNNKISDATLKSPADGQVIGVNKRKGETVSAVDSVIEFLLSGPFQIEVDIYEEDIVNVEIDNYVKVELPAFPDDVFNGRVISVDPAEKLIGGVVYYEVNISFEISGQNIKPGMTADIVIETDKKDNVLVVPAEAIEKRNGVKMAKVYIGKQLVYRDIEIGLDGEDYTEILSGLEEGDMVIISEKQK